VDITDELQKLEALHSSGAVNDEEYTRAKALVLSGRGEDSKTRPAGEPNLLQKFARSSRDRWLGGVCGGLGANTPVPSWAWRLCFCALLLSFGIGLIPYILLWIFVPADVDLNNPA
jgi:phage shock protein PspC (stress-responsive transcriptional regulator)